MNGQWHKSKGQITDAEPEHVARHQRRETLTRQYEDDDFWVRVPLKAELKDRARAGHSARRAYRSVPQPTQQCFAYIFVPSAVHKS